MAKEKIYCKYCKGLKYGDFGPNICKFQYKDHDTPMSKVRKYENIEDCNKKNYCDKYKSLNRFLIWVINNW